MPSKGGDTPLIHFDSGRSGENTSDNHINSPDEAKDISHVVLFLPYSPVLAIVLMPAIAIILTTISGVGLIKKLFPHKISSVCISSSKGVIPRRCFARQLYVIGESWISQDKIGVWKRLVDKSIQEATKLYY